MLKTRRNRWPGLALVALVAFVASASTAAALPFNEVPEAMGSALGVSTDIASLMLACGILFAVLMPMAMVKMKPLPIAATTTLVLALMVGVGWLPVWVLLVVVMMAAATFASFVKGIGG